MLTTTEPIVGEMDYTWDHTGGLQTTAAVVRHSGGLNPGQATHGALAVTTDTKRRTTKMQLELNEEQLDYIIDECKSSIEFGDWYGNFTKDDISYLYTLVSLMKECLHLKENNKDG